MPRTEKPHLQRAKKGWNRSHWASKIPFGFRIPHPNNFAEVTRALAENRDEAGFAWRIISQGVCDGCALGVSGLTDWTTDGPHICNIRLRLLRLNTMPALDTELLGNIALLKTMTSADLRGLGRLPYPMIRHKGEPGFTRISWDEALDFTANRIKATTPDRIGFYLTGRGTVNETYYAAQKAVRAMGTNSIDNAARICHAPSTIALKQTIGVGASTCSYSDWIGTDLLVFIGSNPANNQPVSTKYMYYARKAGTKIVMVNTYREPGMERYWIPSIPESALFGTKLVDDTYLVATAGDAAFFTGALKHIIEHDLLDPTFVHDHTVDFDLVGANVAAIPWSHLVDGAGVSEARMREFGQLVGLAKTAVFVWSMGVTQHVVGEDNVRAIINLALTRGFVGREMCGLMPIRGHSGIQGGSEMGAYATALPGGGPITEESAAVLGQQWGFDVPSQPGLIVSEMVDRAGSGDLDVFFAAGGNLLEVLPHPAEIERALSRIPLRVHQDIVLSNQMFVEPDDAVIILPAATRYETPGGVTQRSTERRIMFSPEIEGRRIGEARPEWEIHLDLARRVRPDRAQHLTYSGTEALRHEIAAVVPSYDGIQHLHKQGDQFQAGGPHLCANWEFPTSDGKAHFRPVTPAVNEIPEGYFAVATRRGKQFNSMIHEASDAITSAVRDAILINEDDAADLNIGNGDPVRLENEVGVFEGFALFAPISRRSLQVHWPEGNVLIDPTSRSPESGVPNYNAHVRVIPCHRDATASAAD